MQVIRKVDGLSSNGHYALAIVEKENVYISGQFSRDPMTGELKAGTIEEETMQVLQNIERILKYVGSDISKVLKASIYIEDLSLWARVNDMYSKFFGDNFHARTILAVKELHYGFKLEMDVIAAL